MSIPKRAFQRLGAGAPATGALGLGVLRIGVGHVLAVERGPLKVSGDDAFDAHNGTLPSVGRQAGRTSGLNSGSADLILPRCPNIEALPWLPRRPIRRYARATVWDSVLWNFVLVREA
jgi:hypothetical protein